MNAPRVLRAVEGDFIAQVRVSADYPAGATSLVPTRRPFHGAGLLVWQDGKTYVRLERAELVFEGKNYNYGSFELRKDGEFVRQASAEELPLEGRATYLRVERRGGTVYGSASADGAEWKSLRPIEVELGKRLLVGVAAGHNTSSAFTAAFDRFQVFQEQGEAGGR
jgi:regulation of enolase protein 1 (concanavalin A-like superfamily)